MDDHEFVFTGFEYRVHDRVTIAVFTDNHGMGDRRIFTCAELEERVKELKAHSYPHATSQEVLDKWPPA